METIDTQRMALGIIGRSKCAHLHVLPLHLNDGVLTVAHDVQSADVKRELTKHTRMDVNIRLMPAPEIAKELRLLLGDADTTIESPVNTMWLEVVERALNLHAVNILVEPTAIGGRVRLDIDGDCDDERDFDRDVYEQLVTRLTTKAFPNFNKNIGQRGRLMVKVDGREVHMRVSAVPQYHLFRPNDTKLVLRVLRAYEYLPSLNRLGMDDDQREMLIRLMAAPRVCLINGAPTAEGKSTTINAAMVEAIPLDSKNCYSIEDPPEFYNPRVTQLAVNEAAVWTYDAALTEVLRQAPHFVFVGEALEQTTVERTVNAGVRGIRNATTLHSVNAIITFEALRASGVNAYAISRSVTATMSQRLLKRLCEHCRIVTEMPEPLIAQAARLGISLNADTPAFAVNPDGCPECFNRGTHGRLAVFEILEMNEELRAAVQVDAKDKELYIAARLGGFSPMSERAIALAIEGTAAAAEVLDRVPPPDAVLERLPDSHSFWPRFELALKRGTLNRRLCLQRTAA